jgi:hypothetical protein
VEKPRLSLDSLFLKEVQERESERGAAASEEEVPK